MSTGGDGSVRALVLVGGQGTRLRPLTYDIPKPMLPIAGPPIIARIVEWLARHGVGAATLSLGYLPESFVKAFPSGEVHGVALSYAVEPEPLDTAGAIRFAAEQAGMLDERIVVVNGDILTDLDLSQLIAFHEARSALGTIALTPVKDPSAYGVVATTEEGRVEAFIEKPAPGTESSNLINAGTYVLEPEALAAIPSGRRASIERETFPELAANGRLYAMESAAYWIDTGTPERYRRAQLDVLRGLRPAVALGEVRTVRPGIFLAAGARLDGAADGVLLLGPSAVIEAGAAVGDAVLGAGSAVLDGARVRDAILLDGVVVEAGALVEAAVVGPGAVIGAGAAVTGDAVVGAGVTIEPGATLRGELAG